MVVQTRSKHRQRTQHDVGNINLSLDSRYMAKRQEGAFLWKSRSIENLQFPSIPRQHPARCTEHRESDVRRSLPFITGNTGRLFKTQLGHSQPNTTGLPKNLQGASYKYEKIAYAATAPGSDVTYNVLPPIYQQTFQPSIGVRSIKRNKMKKVNGEGNPKWKDDCLCLRCKMMKEHWESGNMVDFENWGKYPCVPDHVINHEDAPAAPTEAPPNTVE